MNSLLDDFSISWTLYQITLKNSCTLYWITFNLAECSIRVTVLLEYYYLSLDKCRRLSDRNSLVSFKFLLPARDFYYADFRFTPLSSCIVTDIFCSQNWSCYLDTGWVLCHISMDLSWFLSNHKKGTSMMFTSCTCQVSTNSF